MNKVENKLKHQIKKYIKIKLKLEINIKDKRYNLITVNCKFSKQH